MGAASATATGAAYAGGLFDKNVKEEVISTLLKTSNPQKRLITSTSNTDSKWQEVWKKYKEDNAAKKAGEDLLSLEGWGKSVSEEENIVPNYFINGCKSKASQKTSGTNSPLYQNFLKYCTRDTLVSDLISENGRTLLTDTSSTEDWKGVWNAYKNANKSDSGSTDKWGFSDWTQKKDNDELPTDYKTRCSTKASETAFETTDIKYLNVLNWCSK
ncbi:hypothetical protein MHF_0351 [Mycoplasma haemofelis Ohio2]|uniref:Uncharacterized protein n=1 Tax=Mycoplasma haemofelis (strain Ohio2) TaxID=859194 RepID=F6FGV7_MYCHI|nr:hypothetical protein MHF_0351 [Mycoplasma haemofelis Ohio2]